MKINWSFLLGVLVGIIWMGVMVVMFTDIGGDDNKSNYELQAVVLFDSSLVKIGQWEGDEVETVAVGYNDDGIYNFIFPDSLRDKGRRVLLKLYNKDNYTIEIKELFLIKREMTE